MSIDEPTCAVWYVSRYNIEYDLCSDEDEAAKTAAALYEADDTPTMLGVQFADGRLIKINEWPAFAEAVQARSAMWAEARDRPAPATRPARDPFTGAEVAIELTEPSWLGERRG